jgi:hypothetical protein
MNPLLTINANDLTTFQRCRRRYLIERGWRVLRWRPRALFAYSIRRAVLQLSQGSDPADAIALARAKFMEQAADPGLDVPRGRDTYVLASDFCAMIGTVLLAVSRTGLPRLHQARPVALSPELTWEFSSLCDDAGALHRWVIADSWDADAISRELHSWHTIGDMAAGDAPLTLHVIVAGQSREGRLQSPWCRAYAHPAIAGRIRFQSHLADGRHGRLSGDQWRPTWLSDLPLSPVEWLQKMDADRVTEGLLIEGSVKQPGAMQQARILSDILQEGQHIASCGARGRRCATPNPQQWTCPAWDFINCDRFRRCEELTQESVPAFNDQLPSPANQSKQVSAAHGITSKVRIAVAGLSAATMIISTPHLLSANEPIDLMSFGDI